MRDLFDTDDIDDETSEFDTADGASEEDGPQRETAMTALALSALDAALTRKSRAVLKRSPSVIVVQVPAKAWVETIAHAVKSMERAPVIKTATERLRHGGIFHRLGGEELKYLRHGRSVLYISQDPEDLLDEAVLSAADVTIAIPHLAPALLRKVIRRVTGGVARGVTGEMARLDLPVIFTVVRPDLTARECVENLRRAVARKPGQPVWSAPLLSDLPLTDDVRKWTDQTLSDLAAVRSGTMPPGQLVFGMLEGPPGTGKTLIAESLARTAGWSFVPSSVGTWFTSGDGALGGVSRNLKSFIDQVLSSEPAIGFMDELDALPDRATMDNRGRDWWTPVINLFLTEIDRLRKSGREVLLIGATNYYDRLDAALIRPGRLQQRVSVMPPQTEAEVIALLRYYLNSDLADADLGTLARVGRGATPASIEGWVKEARAAARAANRALEPGDILERMIPKDDREPADIRSTAIHEAGHAIVAHRLGQTVESVSIIPAGDAGGLTTTRLSTVMPTWLDLLDMVTVSLGGRAADIVLGGGPNAGAQADLANATGLLLNAWERQGLRESLVFGPAFNIRPISVRDAVNTELKRLLDRAVAIVEADRDLTLHLAERLIADRVLSGNVLAELLGPRSQPPDPRRKSRAPRDKEQPSPQNKGHA